MAHNTSGKFCSACNLIGTSGHGRSDHPNLDPHSTLCGITCLLIPSASPVLDFKDDIFDYEEEGGNGGLDDELNSGISNDEGIGRADWTRRSRQDLKKQAYSWKAADAVLEHTRLWKKFGVRWSELWRLPYWDPVKQLVADPMHALLEGIVQNHFREILHLSEEFRDTPGQIIDVGFSEEELDDPNKLEGVFGVKVKVGIKQIRSHVRNIIKHITGSIQADDAEEWKNALSKKLATYNKPALFFVVKGLGLAPSDYTKLTCLALADAIVNWVSVVLPKN